MKTKLDMSLIEKFNVKELYKKVLNLFDEYNTNKLASICGTYPQNNYEEKVQKSTISNPTYTAIANKDKYIKLVERFEEKLNFIKEQFTEEEYEIFKLSIVERKSDKIVMSDLPILTPHKYYEIKRSTYGKIGLGFGLLKPKEKLLASQIKKENNNDY